MSKSERFGLVFTPTEKAALVRLAEAEGGLSRAATLRLLIRREAQRQGLWSPDHCDEIGEQAGQHD